MRTPRRSLPVSIALAALVASASAHAQPEPQRAFPRCELEAAERERFRARYGEGRLALTRGEPKRAREALAEALRICVEDEVLWFLAEAEAQLGQMERAQRTLASWRDQRRLEGLTVDEPPPPEWARGAAQAPSDRERARGELHALRLDAARRRGASFAYGGRSDPPSLPLGVRSQPPSIALETSPRAGPLRAHQSSARPSRRARGSDREERTRSQRTAVGYLSIETTPAGAEILTEQGELLGVTPLDRRPVRAGRRLRLRIEKPGFQTLRREVVIEDGIHQRMILPLRDEQG